MRVWKVRDGFWSQSESMDRLGRVLVGRDGLRQSDDRTEELGWVLGAK